LDCGKETLYYDKDPNRPANADLDWYMVKDEIWNKYVPECPKNHYRKGPGDKGYYLCRKCLEVRIGRKLEKDDFTDAEVNKENKKQHRQKGK
jgi:hypothetical protein